VLVIVAGVTSVGIQPHLAWLYLPIVAMGGVGWAAARGGRPTAGALVASAGGLVYPWYGVWAPESATTVASEVGWLVLATCMAAVTLRPVLYVLFATTNSTVMLGLASVQPALGSDARWALGGLLGLLFLTGGVVSWQRRRMADDVEAREAELRLAERDARRRAAAAEAARDRLERAHTELMTQSRTAVVGELSTAIGHEINSPLTALLMAAESLADIVPRDPEVRQTVQLISEATLQCREVVSRLLRHAHVRHALRSTTDLTAVTLDAIELTRHHLELGGASLEVELDETIEVWGNEGELRQVLFNLLVHVASREPRRVVIRGGTSQDRAWLAIRDDGDPMAESQRAAAFQPLLAGRPSPMIGLALCRTLVRGHGGQITLTSNASGCTFTVALPRDGGRVAG